MTVIIARKIVDGQQCNNTRRNRVIEHNGEKMTLTQWSRKLNIKRSTLSNRINTYGWSIEKALKNNNKKL